MNPREDERIEAGRLCKAARERQAARIVPVFLGCACLALMAVSCIVPPPQEAWPDLPATQDDRTQQGNTLQQDDRTQQETGARQDPGSRRDRAEGPAETETAPAGQGPLLKALLYLPNRIVDFTDIFSFGLSLITTASDPPLPSFIMPAAGLHVNVHATRAVQFGLGVTYNIFVGKGYQRRFYWKDSQHEASLLPFTAWKYKTQDRDSKEQDFVFSKGGMLYPSDPPFHEGYLDYWAAGVSTTLVVFGVSVDVHPVEIADAILGFALVDISGDDF